MDFLYQGLTNDAIYAQEKLTSTLNTSDINIFSHIHGRQRREERNIKKKELQIALKYGNSNNNWSIYCTIIFYHLLTRVN